MKKVYEFLLHVLYFRVEYKVIFLPSSYPYTLCLSLIGNDSMNFSLMKSSHECVTFSAGGHNAHHRIKKKVFLKKYWLMVKKKMNEISIVTVSVPHSPTYKHIVLFAIYRSVWRT